MTLTHSESKLRVAICGGGIGGLTLACALSNAQNTAVDVYEAASQFSEIGAGVTILPRAMLALTGMGLAKDIAAIDGSSKTASGTAAPTIVLRRADRPEMQMITEFGGGATVTAHRAEFHDILLRHISKDFGLHTSKRLLSYSDPADKASPIRLVFADGSEATCDILIGADGIKSAVRASMYNNLAEKAQDKEQAAKLRECIPPRFSGATSYRAIIPMDKLAHIPLESSLRTVGQGYTGNGATCVSYPISQGRILNVAVTTFNYDLEWTLHPQPWVVPAKSDEFAHIFKDWAEEVRVIIAGFEGIEMKKWVVNVVQPLDTWITGRVALLGDAAHAMTQFQGAGAAQAIEDAHMLSTLLMHPRATRDTIQQVLRTYQDVRRPIAMKVFNASRRNGQLMSDSSIPLEDVARESSKMAAGTSEGSPFDDVQRAMEMFETATSSM